MQAGLGSGVTDLRHLGHTSTLLPCPQETFRLRKETCPGLPAFAEPEHVSGGASPGHRVSGTPVAVTRGRRDNGAPPGPAVPSVRSGALACGRAWLPHSGSSAPLPGPGDSSDICCSCHIRPPGVPVAASLSGYLTASCSGLSSSHSGPRHCQARWPPRGRGKGHRGNDGPVPSPTLLKGWV